MSERQMRESYLPAYKAALDEGCEMVTMAFNTVDGIPASGNKWLMRTQFVMNGNLMVYLFRIGAQ